MRACSKGFVLFTVLIFLQLFSLISLQGITAISMNIKSCRDLWQRNRHRQEINHLLHRLEFHLLSEKERVACLISTTLPEELAQKPISWWQQFSCSGIFLEKRYYYVVEALGKDSCAAIKYDTNHIVIAEYYRITLLFLQGQANDQVALFQSTVAKAGDEIASCYPSHAVKPGRQMLREIERRITIEGSDLTDA